jgi:hypothetical protein
MKFKFLSLVLVFFLFACNNGAEYRPDTTDTIATTNDTNHEKDFDGSGTVDSTVSMTEDTAMVEPSAGHGADSIQSPGDGPTPVAKRSAVLGCSFFKEIARNDTRSFHAYIMINHPESAVLDTLKVINSDDRPDRKSDTATIFTENLSLYKFVDVQLQVDDSDFVIHPVHDNSRQLIDNEVGNHWEWKVKPITSKKNAVVTLKVVAEKPDGTKDQFASKNFHIKIIILPSDFSRGMWAWIVDHPGIIITALLIPLIIIIARKKFGSKDDSKKE